MPTRAHKFCRDVEPSYNLSYDKSKRRSIIPKDKATRSVHIEIKKDGNNASYTPLDSSGTNIRTLKSKDTVLIKNNCLIPKAINTLISGPLKCDNNCVTLVRRREQQPTCKCSKKKSNYRLNVKQIQTSVTRNFFNADKACSQHVEIANVSTQLLNNSSLTKPKQKYNSYTPTCTKTLTAPTIDKPSTSNNQFIEMPKYCLEKKENPFRLQAIFERYRKHSKRECPFGRNSVYEMYRKCQNNGMEWPFRYVSKRWAISSYPTSGPDF